MDVLGNENLQHIYSHECSFYPEECCGVVFADCSVHLGNNIQNELNRRNPEVYQRRAANGRRTTILA